MPIVEISAFESRFDDDQVTREVIARVTDALCEVFGEGVREETWVIVKGVRPEHWGFGGEVRG